VASEDEEEEEEEEEETAAEEEDDDGDSTTERMQHVVDSKVHEIMARNNTGEMITCHLYDIIGEVI
jgi:HSP90 family molecular chaperone